MAGGLRNLLDARHGIDGVAFCFSRRPWRERSGGLGRLRVICNDQAGVGCGGMRKGIPPYAGYFGDWWGILCAQ
jgi:hypothetical protein